MKIQISILILTMMISMFSCENPGTVLDIKMPVIQKVKDEYFLKIFKEFGHQSLPDITSSHLEITDITADISNTSPDNLKFEFNEGTNVLNIQIDSTSIDVSLNFHYSESVVSVSGSARLQGPISKLTLNLGFGTKAESTYFIPQISVEGFDINLDKGAFSFEFSCHHCPGFVEDLVEKYLKDDLIDKIEEKLNDQIPSQMNSAGNEALDKFYPRSITLFRNIDIETAMSGAITVKSDHLEIPLDSTIFLHEKGYHRTEVAPVIPTYNPNDPGEIMLFLSPYVLATLSDALNDGIQSYNTTFMGIECLVTLDSAVGKTNLTFEEKDLSIKFSPKITIPSYNVGIEITAKAKLDLKIGKGDSTNMLYITPKINSLYLSMIQILFNDTPINISFMAYFLNFIVQSLINQMAIPTIPIAKLSMLPLHLINSELDFHTTYGEFGIVFDFGIESR